VDGDTFRSFVSFAFFDGSVVELCLPHSMGIYEGEKWCVDVHSPLMRAGDELLGLWPLLCLHAGPEKGLQGRPIEPEVVLLVEGVRHLQGLRETMPVDRRLRRLQHIALVHFFGRLRVRPVRHPNTWPLVRCRTITRGTREGHPWLFPTSMLTKIGSVVGLKGMPFCSISCRVASARSTRPSFAAPFSRH